MDQNDQFFLFDTNDKPKEPWEIDAEGEIPAAQVVFPEGIVQPLDYAIPEEWVGKIQPGSRLLVPLGKSNRPCEVFCVAVHTISAARMKLKFVSKILDERPLLSGQMLRLTQWIGEHWLTPWGQVLQCVLPAGVRTLAGTKMVALLSLSQKGKEALALRKKAQAAGRTPESYANFESKEKVLKSSKEKDINEGIPPDYRLTPTQATILETLEKLTTTLGVEELARRAKTSSATVRLLKNRGFLDANQERVSTGAGDYLSGVTKTETDLALNTEQQAAFGEIRALLAQRTPPPPVLLHGVTGSGKTEIYIQAIREVVRSGRQAIVLVPEISLTPQTVERFRRRFENIAVLHSRLTDAQRHSEWTRIMSGSVEVVIGARSAVFAPTPRLGLIVIDEEHETSFKQETAPRYHARDVAIERGKMENALVLLGSATPSLESWHHAQGGEYRLLPLMRRVEERPMPSVEPVDLRIRDDSATGVIGRKLHLALHATLSRGRQAILLLNRRGFSTHIQCPSCGVTLTCPHCEISLTHHQATQEVICHYCDYHAEIPRVCPECKSSSIRFSGTGTQRLEMEISRRFPQARVFRMDTDSMQARGSHEKVFKDFREGKIDILLGTQMIAKGLDFPNVTLVGVINADTALHLPDFRAEERTFQLITQVAGRTGRGALGGSVLVQTYQPENEAIDFACRHDYSGFARYALPLREKLFYPPFGFLARVVIRGTKEDETLTCAQEIKRKISAEIQTLRKSRGTLGADLAFRVLGPAPCPIPKLRDFYRFHIQAHAPDRSILRDALARVQAETKTPEDVQWIVDLDPYGML
ncbi:MAG: primosomal protein N' [Planctomycetia bacterium]|nr:primosomal protein N' [Planctomycetia bacterium]